MERASHGWLSGLAGVIIFAGSLPATRAALQGFDPIFLTSSRAVIAAGCAGLLLAGMRQARPDRAMLLPLAIVAGGVVLGFPLLTAIALQWVSAAHSIVFVGLLPLATAGFAVLRAGERPRAGFWFFSTLGSLCVAGFALRAGVTVSPLADLSMLAAVLLCGLGYAEGGRLSRSLGGWQVISWALILAAPVMLVLALATRPQDWGAISGASWVALGYVSLFSMLIGFVFWYRGLALGGIARIGQLQLLQPFIGLSLADLFLGERIDPAMLFATSGVVLCVAGARWAAPRRS